MRIELSDGLGGEGGRELEVVYGVEALLCKLKSTFLDKILEYN